METYFVMDKFQHPIIVCTHKLNLSSLEELARELAIESKLTIQIENEDGLKITFEPPKHIFSGELKINRLKIIPDLKYKLISDNYQLYLFAEFIEIKFTIEVDYYHFLHLYKRDELKEFLFFQDFFGLLKTFGATEIYFGIFEEFKNVLTFIYSWENVTQKISESNYFKVSI